MHPPFQYRRSGTIGNDLCRPLLAVRYSLHALNVYGIDIKHYFMQTTAYNDNYRDAIYALPCVFESIIETDSFV